MPAKIIPIIWAKIEVIARTISSVVSKPPRNNGSPLNKLKNTGNKKTNKTSIAKTIFLCLGAKHTPAYIAKPVEKTSLIRINNIPKR